MKKSPHGIRAPFVISVNHIMITKIEYDISSIKVNYFSHVQKRLFLKLNRRFFVDLIGV